MAATATKEQIRRFPNFRRCADNEGLEEWTDIAVPAVVTQDLSGVLCGYHLAHIVRPGDGCDGAFLSRALRGYRPTYQYQVSAKWHHSPWTNRRFHSCKRACSPTLPEQRAIAAFLDRETAKIDSLVTKKERLIELLQEKRTALISRAVTKGLDPDVPMKDSGVEWLGQIPAHWEVKRLKQSGHIPTWS